LRLLSDSNERAREYEEKIVNLTVELERLSNVIVNGKKDKDEKER